MWLGSLQGKQKITVAKFGGLGLVNSTAKICLCIKCIMLIIQCTCV